MGYNIDMNKTYAVTEEVTEELKGLHGDKVAVARIDEILPIEGADRIVIARIGGYNFVVSKDYNVGDLVLVFDGDGLQIDEKFAVANRLLRYWPDAYIDQVPMGAEMSASGRFKMGGYIEANCRIRKIVLRKVPTDGLILKVDTLAKVGIDPNIVKEGDQFSSIDGIEIARKYISQAAQNAAKALKEGGSKNKRFYQPEFIPSKYLYTAWCQRFVRKPYVQDFLKQYVAGKLQSIYDKEMPLHINTPKLRLSLNGVVALGIDFVVTDKWHGTSARTGVVMAKPDSQVDLMLVAFEEYLKDKKVPAIITRMIPVWRSEMKALSGTRKVIMGDDYVGYYGTAKARDDWHSYFAPLLNLGEVVYYEIVGYMNDDNPIMKPAVITKAQLSESGVSLKSLPVWLRNKVRDGEPVTFNYDAGNNESRIRVYRITQNGVDLPWDEMVARCKELGVDTVKELFRINSADPQFIEKIREAAEDHSDGQLREGVVLRALGNVLRLFKYKSHLFCIIEGIMDNESLFVNAEEFEKIE